MTQNAPFPLGLDAPVAYFIADCAVLNEFLLELVCTVERLFTFLLHAVQFLLDGGHRVERCQLRHGRRSLARSDPISTHSIVRRSTIAVI